MGMKWIQTLPTMVMGADVSHPSPGSFTPSITALVSSVDHRATTYVASTRPQQSRVEKIGDLGDMFEIALAKFNQFNRKHNLWPQRVVFYRDGLSEGEFDTVAHDEIQDLYQTMNRVWKEKNITSPKPLLLYIIAIKRHHVRFFPDGGPADRSDNVPAGFVADRDVTAPHPPDSARRDWFLQSHGGILGTSRPTHYEVIENRVGLSSAQIQQLTFELCHSYARATRSVSVVAPVYYADIVCSRAKYHTGNVDFSDTASADGVDKETLLQTIQSAWNNVHQNTSTSMYWM